jgi:hypothetical protein
MSPYSLHSNNAPNLRAPSPLKPLHQIIPSIHNNGKKVLNLIIMQVQVDIGFDQLLSIVKALPKGQLKQLKAEIEKEVKDSAVSKTDIESLLLKGPIATKRQLDIIANNRKAINQWRAG